MKEYKSVHELLTEKGYSPVFYYNLKHLSEKMCEVAFDVARKKYKDVIFMNLHIANPYTPWVPLGQTKSCPGGVVYAKLVKKSKQLEPLWLHVKHSKSGDVVKMTLDQLLIHRA